MKTTLLIISLSILNLNLYSQINLGNGLYASYPFSGNANDISGYFNNGTITNAILGTDRFGNASSAYEFDGTSAYIDFDDVLDNVFAGVGKNFSISLWMKPYSLMSNNIFFAKNADGGCSGNDRGILFRLLNNEINFTYSSSLTSGNVVFISASAPITDTTHWYHVVLTYDGTINTGGGLDRVQIYIDNQLETTYFPLSPTGSLASIQDGNAHMGMGNYLNTTGGSCNATTFYEGKIDDVRIYNRVINSAEVDALFNGGVDVGITENTINLSNVYPSITTGKINIQLPNENSFNFKILNQVGQILHSSEDVSSSNYEMDLASFANGIYIVRIETPNGIEVHKIVKQ